MKLISEHHPLIPTFVTLVPLVTIAGFFTWGTINFAFVAGLAAGLFCMLCGIVLWEAMK